MPYIAVTTNYQLDEATRKEFVGKLVAVASAVTRKPAGYVMASVNCGVTMALGCSTGNCCFADFRGIGLTASDNSCREINKVIKSYIPDLDERVYITFQNVSSSNWGMDGSLFG